MKYHTFYFNPIRECTFVVWDESRSCIVIDPGCATQREFSRLEQFIEENSLVPCKILLTHAHFDHIMGVELFRRRYGTEVCMHSEEECQLRMADVMASFADCTVEVPEPPFTFIGHGEKIHFGNSALEAIWTPGHTAGGLCYYSADDAPDERRDPSEQAAPGRHRGADIGVRDLLFCGDTMFEGGIGRTDLPTGNYETLLESIRSRILTLPDETTLLPGHGYPTTIGRERASNPFLAN